jgi:hypothetical protein
LTALLFFTAGTSLLAYGIASLGLLSKNKIVVTTLATTGPDFEVVLGQFKLKSQLPDTTLDFNLDGIMVRGNAVDKDLSDNLQRNYLEFGDYFVLTEKVVGMQQSDGPSYHPLVEILRWRHIDKVLFWLLATLNVALFMVGLMFHRKYIKRCQRPGK